MQNDPTKKGTVQKGRGPREPLSRQRVLEAALDLVDAEGLDALSMRKVAASLHVEAMSLYNHVQNKRDMCDGLIDLMWSMRKVDIDQSLPWREQLRQSVVASYQMIQGHHRAALLWAHFPGEHAELAPLEEASEILVSSGFQGEQVHYIWHTLVGFLIGYVLTYNIDIPPPRPGFSSFQARVADLPPESALRQVSPYFMDCTPDPPFHVGLELILDGIGGMLKQGAQHQEAR